MAATSESKAAPAGRSAQDSLYQDASDEFGQALGRLARAYEADPDKRRDLLQEIHVALWRSFASFQGRCSVRTWVFRVAHNAAASHVIRQKRVRSREWLSIDEADAASDQGAGAHAVDRQQSLERLLQLIHRLKPLDRQIMLLYLEGSDAASIAEISGISAANVATKIHRIKNVLARRFHQGGVA